MCVHYPYINFIWITCTIKGRVKEATPKANIECRTLNYPHKNSRSSTFNSGENLYLYFRSPVDGYLSVFSEEGEQVYRLLPYSKFSSQSTVRVIADKEYIYFSPKKEHDYFNKHYEEAPLSTSKQSEWVTLHILFSEDEYFKPGLSDRKKIENEERTYIPNSLSRKQFETWLTGNKIALNDFIDAEVNVEILGE